MAPSGAWLPALRRYFSVIVVGNLIWEFAQLPLYTLWKAASAKEIILAVPHCTGGDLLIAGATLVASVVLLGTSEWPCARFLLVAGTTLISGVGVTAYSEHLNTALGAWAYSDLMPILPGTGIGLSPLAQWFVIPILAFTAARSVISVGHLDLPIMGITTSRFTPNHLARSDRKMS
jgi:hypothetical protein